MSCSNCSRLRSALAEAERRADLWNDRFLDLEAATAVLRKCFAVIVRDNAKLRERLSAPMGDWRKSVRGRLFGRPMDRTTNSGDNAETKGRTL